MTTLGSRFRQVGLHRRRLLAAAVAATAAFFFLPEGWTFTARVLVAWNLSVWPYLAALVWLILRSTSDGVRGIATQEDASSAGLMLLMCTAAILSLVAIMVELAHGRDGGESPIFVYGVTLLTVADLHCRADLRCRGADHRDAGDGAWAIGAVLFLQPGHPGTVDQHRGQSGRGT